MPYSGKFGKREHPAKLWVLKLLDNIRSEITWIDLLAGLSAAIIFALLLVGFRYQVIPSYPVGTIATQEVRAMQTVSFEDIEATVQKRASARAAVPAVYDIDTQLISSRIEEIKRSLAEARGIVTRLQSTKGNRSVDGQLSSVMAELETGMGETLIRDLLPLLVRSRFHDELEDQIIGVLERTLRNGILQDSAWQKYLGDRPGGILLKDNSPSGGIRSAEGAAIQNLSAARDGLSSYTSSFASLSSGDRALVRRFLQGALFATLSFDERETAARRDAAAAQILPAEVHIKKGMVIVRSGDEVTKSIASQLQALRNMQRPRSLLGQFIGFFFFALAFIYALWRYFVHYQSKHRSIRNHTLLILTVVTAVLLVMRLITELADILSERLSIEVLGNPFLLDYAIPFAFGSILVTLLVDTNLGILTSIIVATLVGLFYGDIYLMAYVFIGSLAGIFSVRQYKDRAAIQKAGLTIGLVNAFGMLGLDFLRQVPPTYANLLNDIGFALVSGLLTSAFASMLLPPLEVIFKITTDIRLLELSNLKSPVLRRLSVEAPGTYHHSLMVGTLSEAAAEAIGANPLLVRVASYYHDLGKMFKPEYYVENQVFGINKHENLSPSMSCLIISSHVKDGMEMAKEIGLSERIRDMIPQHHGTRIMSYFFQKAKGSLDGKNQEVEESDFRYPGPKPQSKEAAIMMMADSVEAASRTLSSPSPAQIQGMIDRLVDDIIADHQLDECDITMRDIRLVKESFLKTLSGLYHRRIDYPGYDFRRAGNEPEQTLASGAGSKSTKAV